MSSERMIEVIEATSGANAVRDKMREIMGRPGPNPAKDRANERAGKL